MKILWAMEDMIKEECIDLSQYFYFTFYKERYLTLIIIPINI